MLAIKKKTGKTTAIRLCLLGIIGEQLRAPLLNPRDYLSTIVSRGLRGPLYWSPIMPKGDSLSIFF